MKNIKKLLLSAIIVLGIGAGIYSAIASTIPIAPAVFETSLASPISTSSTTMTLTSGTLANGSTLSGYACFTVDSGNPNVEFICGTASGTSITSLLRGVDTLTGNTSVASLIFSHRRGANVKITDFPVFSVIRNIANGSDTFPNPITYGVGVSPVANQDLTTKAYVLSVVNGGTVTTNALTETGTAGETVSAGQVLYLKVADGRWWKADASTASTVDTIQLGIAQGAGTAGNAITNGVLRRGLDSNQSGGSAGALGYIKNSGGTVGTTTGTTERVIGNFITATTFNFNPTYYYTLTANQKGAMAGNVGTPSSTNKFVTEQGINTTFGDGSDGTGTISGTTTLTKDMYYTDLSVTGTLNTAGYRVFVSGTLSGNGTIQNNGADGSAGTPGAQGAGGLAGAVTTGYFSNVAGTAGGAGPNTGAGVAGNNGVASGNGTSLLITTASSVGGAGGTGSGTGTSTGGASGTRTGVLTLFGVIKWQTLGGLDIATSGSTIKVVPSMPGTGGGSGTSGNGSGGSGSGGAGGGGGASGGVIALYVKTFTGTTTIKSVGGNGGAGASGTGAQWGGGGGGAGGNGGYIFVVYNTKTWTGSYVLTGGTGAAGAVGGGAGGTGGTGNNGSVGSNKEMQINALF